LGLHQFPGADPFHPHGVSGRVFQGLDGRQAVPSEKLGIEKTHRFKKPAAGFHFRHPLAL
jgi:hypothetical protein